MLLAIVLVLGIAPSITACRYSDVLTEHIQQQDAEVDPNAEPQYKNVADATPQDFQSYQEQQTDNIDEQEETLPEFSELPTTVQETIITQYIQDSDNNTEAATGGNDASDAKARTNSSDGTNTSNNQSGSNASDQKGNGTSKNSGADQKPSRSDNTGTGSSAGDEASNGGLPSSNNQNTGSDPTGGNGGSGKIVAGGSYDSLPANTHTIAACGE